MPPAIRRQVLRSCKRKGWLLQPEALEGIEEWLSGADDLKTELDAIVEQLKLKLEEEQDGAATRRKKNETVITGDLWKKVLAQVVGDPSDTATVAPKRSTIPGSWSNSVSIVSAFSQPKLVYNVIKKQFCVEEKQGGLFGSAADKVRQ